MTVAVAYATRRTLLAESIYTVKLTRRGHHVPQALLTEFALVQPVWEVANHRVVCVGGADTVADTWHEHADTKYFVIAASDGARGGILRRRRLLEALLGSEILDLAVLSPTRNSSPEHVSVGPWLCYAISS